MISCTITAFWAKVWARSVEPVMVMRFISKGAKLTSALESLHVGDVNNASLRRSDVEVLLDVVAADHVENDVNTVIQSHFCQNRLQSLPFCS